MPLSDFDGVVYINLEHREDRKAAFLKEMERLQVQDVHRICGHHDPLNGVRGCLMSHLKALDFIQTQGWQRGLVLEDDCFFVEDLSLLKKQIGDFFQSIQDNWDVFLLGGRYLRKDPTQWENVVRIRYSRWSHAYCVRKEYIPSIQRCFQLACAQIQSDLFFINSQRYALDLSWESLQSQDRWYAPLKPLAFQSASFSDIEHAARVQRCE